jgi:signal transduction histidine kinase
MTPILTVTLNSELDVIASRQRARQISAFCGFNRQDQTWVSTVVSELARNASGPGGVVRFLITLEAGQQSLVVQVECDTLDARDSVASGALQSNQNNVWGPDAAWLFMDQCEVVVHGERRRITLRRPFAMNARHLDSEAIRHAVHGLDALPVNVALSDATQQNRELTEVLMTLQAKQVELLRVSKQLEETNKTVETLNRLLNEKAQSLISADRRKDEFLSLLSHELRSPLSATSMAAQMLQNFSDSAQPAKLGQLINRQVSHMSRLVEDLLDVSRIGRGLLSIEKKPLDMREVVDVAVEQLTAALRRKKHRIEVSVPPAPCVVDGDRTRLIQVVGNLLANAIRYTPDGGDIKVVLQLHGTNLSVEVRDNGIGIPAELLPHLFDMYVQAERSSERQHGGLGLGLALVKSLVDIHHGTVSVSSEGEGRGSAFKFILELAKYDDAAAFVEKGKPAGFPA